MPDPTAPEPAGLDPAAAIDRLRAAFRGPAAHRTLHAKGRFYAGTFTPTPEAGELCRAGHLRAPTPVLVRWSNAGGNAAVPDPTPDIRGMAVKFRLADGTATDLLGQTSPRFPTDDPEEFVAMTEASVRPLTFPFFLARHPRLLPSVLASLRAHAVSAPVSFAEPAYFPIHAYGWLDDAGRRAWVRYAFVPQASAADRLPERFEGPDRLFEEMAARLERGPVTHEVRVQVAGPGHDPHSATSVWKGARELVAGHLVVHEPLPDQEADGPVVFDPTRVVDGIELSDDPILRYRPAAYTESVSRRG
ncbi:MULTISPECIES: catalase family peroxidase [unclassified Nocardioides]|uniref:catalase family peroxidase n=1 Tax=unclassified Nocardioides TaxID=2615069 RepID=UPI000057109A|nr:MULTISPECIES: catalase family peroxidase [unclassified Nocardioides]ABL83840.1 Catalase domain protein [Nocardioides sp. JS614]